MTKRFIFRVLTIIVLAGAFALAVTAQNIITAPNKGQTTATDKKIDKNKTKVKTGNNRGATPAKPTVQKSLLEQGQDAFNSMNYAQALELWTKAKDSGDVDAMFRIGTLYEQGLGVEKDLNIAYHDYYIKAARDGSPEALAFFEDDGTITDAVSQFLKGHQFNDQSQLHKAFYWYQKSAAQGDELAQSAMGTCYRDGIGVAKNEKEAIFWFWRAISHKENLSITWVNLGSCYEEGIGVDKDEDTAWMYYYIGAIHYNGKSNEEACKKFGDTGQPLTNAQMNQKALEGKEKGNEWWTKYWYRKSSLSGDSTDLAQTEAQYQLGSIFYNERSYEKAVEFLTLAANRDNSWGAKAQVLLGLCYKSGRGVNEDGKKAPELFARAWENGDWDGACFWAIECKWGSERIEFVWEKDQKVHDKHVVFSVFEQAALHGNKMGQAYLGYCYQLGIGTSKDKKKAFEWYQKSASGEEPNDLGIFNLAKCYQFGNGCKKNLSMALDLFNKVNYSFEKSKDYNMIFEPHFALALLYEQMNEEIGESPTNTEMAIKHYQEAYKIKHATNNMREAEDALKRLGGWPIPDSDKK